MVQEDQEDLRTLVDLPLTKRQQTMLKKLNQEMRIQQSWNLNQGLLVRSCNHLNKMMYFPPQIRTRSHSLPRYNQLHRHSLRTHRSLHNHFHSCLHRL